MYFQQFSDKLLVSHLKIMGKTNKKPTPDKTLIFTVIQKVITFIHGIKPQIFSNYF